MNNIIKEISKLCSLSYNSPKINKELFTSRPYFFNKNECVFYQCQEEPHFYSTKKDCQAYVCKFDNILCISFRGTESIEDILTDLNISRVPIEFDFPLNLKEDIHVHRGFLNQFNSIKLNIDQEIIEYYIKDSNTKKIIFSGHSLGGALATIASLYFKLKYKDLDISCITFGSPRVGCKDFVKLFNKQIENSYRFVNDNDPVPCIPTAWRFKHVKGVQWINKDKIVHEIKVWRFYRFIKNLFLSFFSLGGYNSLIDHSCDEYIKDLEIVF
jgi:hypothetical protein